MLFDKNNAIQLSFMPKILAVSYQLVKKLKPQKEMQPGCCCGVARTRHNETVSKRYQFVMEDCQITDYGHYGG